VTVLWGDMMFNIIICDDSVEDLSYIERHLRKGLEDKKQNAEISTFTDPQTLLIRLCSGALAADVVFVDIDMPNMNGIEFAQKLNEICPAIETVFITNHDEFVYKAYRCKAIGFIRKKDIDTEMSEVIDVICQHLLRKNKKIIIEESGCEIPVSVLDIIYVKSDNHYVELFTTSGKRVLRNNINSFEKEYSLFGFIRVHIRYIVNIRFIQAIEKRTVLLTNKEQIPISRNKSAFVKEQYQFYSRVIL
jgi:DNA-binding LytR/AlgR family response regulator